VIADASMNDSEFKYHLVEGLGNNNGADSAGWLVFTKTRACNPEFYRWFAKEVVVNFVKTCRKRVKVCIMNGN
jgi:hypothetical protein